MAIRAMFYNQIVRIPEKRKKKSRKKTLSRPPKVRSEIYFRIQDWPHPEVVVRQGTLQDALRFPKEWEKYKESLKAV